MTSKNVQIILTKNLEPSYLKLGPVNKNYIQVFYPLNSQDEEFTKLYIQTPKMRVPWEKKERKTKQGKVFAYSLTASTDHVGTSKNITNIDLFREKILKIEDKIKSSLPSDFKNKTFYSSLWQGNNSDFKPTMRLSIPCYNDEAKVAVYKDKDSVEVERVTARSVCSFIIVLDSIWSTFDKVGINWNIDEIVIWDEIKIVSKTRCMVREEEDDDDE
jgi:hypothetical protein